MGSKLQALKEMLPEGWGYEPIGRGWGILKTTIPRMDGALWKNIRVLRLSPGREVMPGVAFFVRPHTDAKGLRDGLVDIFYIYGFNRDNSGVMERIPAGVLMQLEGMSKDAKDYARRNLGKFDGRARGEKCPLHKNYKPEVKVADHRRRGVEHHWHKDFKPKPKAEVAIPEKVDSAEDRLKALEAKLVQQEKAYADRIAQIEKRVMDNQLKALEAKTPPTQIVMPMTFPTMSGGGNGQEKVPQVSPLV